MRIYGLGGESLWLDEGGSILFAEGEFKNFLIGQMPYLTPPFYYVLLDFWMGLFGRSEFAVRLISVLFSSLNIFLIYLIGKDIYGRKTGLIAAFILSVSVFNIYFAREARMYSLLSLLAACSMLTLIRTIRLGEIKYAVLYLIFSGLLLHTHNLAIMPVIGQNIFVLAMIIRKRNIGSLTWRKWLLIQAVLILLFIPWLTIILRQFAGIQTGSLIVAPTSLFAPLETLVFFSGSTSAALVYSSLVILALLGRKRSEINSGSPASRRPPATVIPFGGLLVCWFLAPIVIPYLVSLISSPIYLTRITIASTPAFFILAARGVETLKQPLRPAAAGILIAALAVFNLRGYYANSTKEPIREVISGIEEVAEPGELIVVIPGWYKRFIVDYYWRRNDTSIKSIYDPAEKNILESLSRWLKSYPRIRIILFQGDGLETGLKTNFGQQYSSENTLRYTYYNYQAGRELEIRVYLLDAGR